MVIAAITAISSPGTIYTGLQETASSNSPNSTAISNKLLILFILASAIGTCLNGMSNFVSWSVKAEDHRDKAEEYEWIGDFIRNEVLRLRHTFDYETFHMKVNDRLEWLSTQPKHLPRSVFKRIVEIQQEAIIRNDLMLNEIVLHS